MLFEAKPKLPALSAIFRSFMAIRRNPTCLKTRDMEDPAVSQEQQNGVVPQPQLEQANQSLVAQTGAQGMPCM